ncbi:type IV secretory system conjugative DNA transfer family protein [Streptomyces sp. NPDC001380]|uniref:type IV secretory system conjugative DNA transfer family protein n=1 Tax=Streptomyces sp. NPDC001380 TaxID=3364566 RepID=UPI00369EBCF4
MTRPPAPSPSAPAPPPRSGIPDGAVVALLAFLLGSVTLVWTATGLAALATRGAWPRDLPFTRSAQALRRLATAPHDLGAAWAPAARTGRAPAPLPSAAAFWWAFLLLLAALAGLLLLGYAARARLSRTAAGGAARAARGADAAPAAPAAAPAVTKPAPDPRPQAVDGDPAPAAPAVPVPAPAGRPAPAGSPEAAPPPPLPRAPAPPHPLSFDALLPRAAAIRSRPDTGLAGPGARTAPNPLAYGVSLGRDTATGTPLLAALDRGHCVLAPPAAARSKGPLLVHPAIAHAPGPVLATCAGPAAWEATAERRGKTGPVLVFDPLRLTAADTPQRLRWAPHDSCGDPAAATARADALLHAVTPPHGGGAAAAVHAAARTLLRCWLHAAALDGRPFRQVHRWAGGHGAREALRVLRTDRGAAEGWGGELEAVLAAPHASGAGLRDAASDLVAGALSSLEELHVLQACSPSPGDRLDVESFLSERGTLYLVGRPVEAPHHQPGVMPLLTALAQDVVERGRRMAVGSSAGRLDPPLLAVLDDVGAVAPLPSLPDLVARGGAQGVPVLAVLRSPEQARARWDGRSVHRLWTEAATRTVLGPADGASVGALLAATAGPEAGGPGPAAARGAAEGEAVVLHPPTGTSAVVRFDDTP